MEMFKLRIVLLKVLIEMINKLLVLEAFYNVNSNGSYWNSYMLLMDVVVMLI